MKGNTDKPILLGKLIFSAILLATNVACPKTGSASSRSADLTKFAADQEQIIIGQSLEPGETLTSANGEFILKNTGSNITFTTKLGTVLWQTPGVSAGWKCTLKLGDDCNLI